MNDVAKLKIKDFHEDKRGIINILEVNGKEFLWLFTKKRFLRGGDYHESIQHDVVLSGLIHFVTLKGITLLGEGQSISSLPLQPHYIKSVTDSQVLEWLEGNFEKKYYAPFRRLVEEKMK